MYADSNNGYLVEYYNQTATSSHTNVQNLTTVKTGGAYDPATSRLYHVGRLWQLKYIGTGEVGYCPANYESPEFGWHAIKGTFPQSVNTSDPVRSDYVFNPHWRQQTNAPTRLNAYAKLQDMPAHRMLAGDLFRAKKYVSHKGRGVRPAWNLVFSDGHVATIVSKEVWDQLGAQGEYGGTEWQKLENYRDMLETLNQGRPLSDNPKGYGHPTNSNQGRVYHFGGERVAGQGTMEGRQATP
jgi:hypothetical protein